MSNGQHGPWTGHKPFPDLKGAVEDAWEKAKAGQGPERKRYTVKIEIEASNPIHAYIVTISPS